MSNPIRIQDYGVGIFLAAPTKSALKKALKKGWVRINGEVANTAIYLRGGERIELMLPEESGPGKQLVFPLQVLLEDEHLAAVHKPAGIVVSGNSFKTMANALPQNLQRSSLADASRPQPVHRLDYPTTGVLLVGKTNSSIRALNHLFAAKEVTKTYYAVTIGRMPQQGTIVADIDGKPAESAYQVLATVASKRFGQLNLVKLSPSTGRRHQLRKHLSGIGHPILGDKDYGKEGLILSGKGLYLHAHTLRFVHPFTQEEVVVISELPGKFNKLFAV